MYQSRFTPFFYFENFQVKKREQHLFSLHTIFDIIIRHFRTFDFTNKRRIILQYKPPHKNHRIHLIYRKENRNFNRNHDFL